MSISLVDCVTTNRYRMIGENPRGITTQVHACPPPNARDACTGYTFIYKHICINRHKRTIHAYVRYLYSFFGLLTKPYHTIPDLGLELLLMLARLEGLLCDNNSTTKENKRRKIREFVYVGERA